MDTILSNDKTQLCTEVNGIEFQVQFYISLSEEKIATFGALNSENMSFIKERGIYQYRLGPYSNLAEAVNKPILAIKAGYKDAFVIAFKDGNRISMEEAKSLISN